MAIINPPAPLPLRNAKWREIVPVQVNKSGWTGRRKIVGQPGAYSWTVSGEFRTIIGADAARQWRAFFSALQGPINAFPVRAVEAPQVNLATVGLSEPSVPGYSVKLGGLPPSTTILLPGHLLTFAAAPERYPLRVLRLPLISNSAGVATATLTQPLDFGMSTGFACELMWPFAMVTLTSEPPGWDVDVGQLYRFAITAEELL